MRIEVHYLSTIDQAVGASKETYELSAHGTIMELLKLVVNVHGNSMRHLVYADDGSLMALCFRNGVRLSPEVPLADGDVVEILLMLSGG